MPASTQSRNESKSKHEDEEITQPWRASNRLGLLSVTHEVAQQRTCLDFVKPASVQKDISLAVQPLECRLLGKISERARSGQVKRGSVCPAYVRRLPMKLRFSPNSVRLRLNQTELANFAKTGELAERIEFPGPQPTVFLYGLRVSADSVPGTITFISNKLIITIPRDRASAWASQDEEIGLYYQHELEDGGHLRVMIEKDFQGVDGPPEGIDLARYSDPLAPVKRQPGAK
jgi:hypothetical protein